MKDKYITKDQKEILENELVGCFNLEEATLSLIASFPTILKIPRSLFNECLKKIRTRKGK